MVSKKLIKMRRALTFLLLVHAIGFARADEVDMVAIMNIESKGKPNAHNKSEDARGLFQIRPCVLQEYNQYNNTRILPDDLFDPVINAVIGRWYMNRRIKQMHEHFKIPDTTRNRIISYNAGIKRTLDHVRHGKPLPKITFNYIKKYERMVIANGK